MFPPHVLHAGVRRFNGIMFRNIRRRAVLGVTGGQLAPRSLSAVIFPRGPSADPSGRTTPNGDYGDSALDFEGRITVHLIRRSGHAASSARKSVGSIKCTVAVIHAAQASGRRCKSRALLNVCRRAARRVLHSDFVRVPAPSSGSHSCHRLYRCCTHLLLCHRPRVAAAAYLRRGFLAQRRLVARPGPLALIEGAASRMSLPSKPSLWKLRTAPHDLSANRQLDRSVWSSASNPLRGYPLGCCVAATLVDSRRY